MDCSGQGKQLICIKMSQERVPSTRPRHSVAQSDRGRRAGWTNRGHSDEYKYTAALKLLFKLRIPTATIKKKAKGYARP